MNLSKKMFVIKVDNVVDVITNSSSELFVLQGENKAIVEEMIENIYPDYKDEYKELECLRDADEESISTYLSWVEDSSYDNWNATRNMSEEQTKKYNVDNAIAVAAKYGMTPKEYYQDWENALQHKWFFASVSPEGARKAAQILDPNGQIFLLFSHDENPDWEYQDKLSNIADRYHLG